MNLAVRRKKGNSFSMLGPADIENIKKAILRAQSNDDISRLENALRTGTLEGIRDLLNHETTHSLASLWDTTKEMPLIPSADSKREAVNIPAPSRKTAREVHEEEMSKKRFLEATQFTSVICDKYMPMVKSIFPSTKEFASMTFEGPEAEQWVSSPTERAGKKKVLILECASVLCIAGDVYVPDVLIRLIVCDFQTDRIILDVNVQFPSAEYEGVDFRPSITGFDEVPEDCVPFEEARKKLLDIMSCDTVLVTHNAYRCTRALRLHHTNWISLDTVLQVDPVKKLEAEGKYYFRQPLSLSQLLHSYLGESVAERFKLLSASERLVENVLGCNRIIRALASDSKANSLPVLVPPMRTYNTIFLTHIPSDWSDEEIKLILPGTVHVDPITFFLDIHANEWRGEACATFPNQSATSDAFAKLTACTDVFVGWEWLACGKVTEESVRKLAEEFGPVLAVRIQDKYLGQKDTIPGKEESRPFGFASLARYKDAQEMAPEPRQIVKDEVSYHVKMSKKPITAFKRVPLGDGQDYIEAFIM